MKGLEDATPREPKTTLMLWAISLLAIYVFVKVFTNLDAGEEFQVTIVTGLALGVIHLGYYILRIPPKLLDGVLKQKSWVESSTKFTLLQAEGQEIIDSFQSDTSDEEKEQKREAWRQKVLEFCDELGPSWSAQFKYQGGIQKEIMITNILSRRRGKNPATVKKEIGVDKGWEFLLDFATEIEQVKGFAKFCLDRAMELTQLKS